MKTRHESKPKSISTAEIYSFGRKEKKHTTWSYVISMSGDDYRDQTEYI